MNSITLKKVATSELIEISNIVQRYATINIEININRHDSLPIYKLLIKDIASQLAFKLRNSYEKNMKDKISIKLKISEAIVLFEVLNLGSITFEEYRRYVANKYKDILHQEIINLI